MNLKKGLKRFWIIGSVFWIGYPFIPVFYSKPKGSKHLRRDEGISNPKHRTNNPKSL
jgi:hypothetical protein